MHEAIESRIILAIAGSSILLLFFALVIIFSVIRYTRRQRQYISEKDSLKLAYAEEKLQIEQEITNQINTKISEEIHDNIGQLLSLAKMQINMVNMEFKEHKAIGKKLNKVEGLIANSISDLRDIAYKLKSYQLWENSWSEILSAEIDKLDNVMGLKIQFDISEKMPDFENEKKMLLLRIVQECIQNIVKHAQASCIEVYSHYSDQALSIKISDNGIGMDLPPKPFGGLGIKNILRRSKLIGATCKFEKNNPKGISVLINLPLQIRDKI